VNQEDLPKLCLFIVWASSAGEVVRCADAREDLVDLASTGRLCGDEQPTCASSAMMANLAHVGRFTAHVGASDEQRAASVR